MRPCGTSISKVSRILQTESDVLELVALNIALCTDADWL